MCQLPCTVGCIFFLGFVVQYLSDRPSHPSSPQDLSLRLGQHPRRRLHHLQRHRDHLHLRQHHDQLHHHHG